jgi:Zn-dependent peptidase ImmA (M78 family)
MFNLVEMLAQKYLKKGKVHYPPVPTELVSLADEHYPIEVRLVPLVASHGAIWYLEDSWVIQLNKGDSPATRRFTLFHEAFHILAHRRAAAGARKPVLATPHFNELLAEQFAACILMPSKLVREAWAKVNDVSKLAEIFAVPKPAACFRLKFLHLI